jgi:DegV family protein with EDD domain
MPGVAIVSDTTHYLPRDFVATNGIHEVSLYVNWSDHQDREADMPDFDAFYERLRSGRELPTTSQPSIGDFLAVYEPLLEAGQDILSIHISGGISGTVEAARQTAAQLDERGFTGRVRVMDSATGCGGLGLVLLAAASAVRAGAAVEEAARRAQEARDALAIWFCVDTLEYLQRGGRVGKAQAWVGGALKIKPILSIESEILPVERVRTAGRAFERMVEYLQSRRDDGADAWVVQHIQARDQAERLVERGREIFGTDPTFVTEVGPVIGGHVGPGLIGCGGIPSRFLA